MFRSKHQVLYFKLHHNEFVATKLQLHHSMLFHGIMITMLVTTNLASIITENDRNKLDAKSAMEGVFMQRGVFQILLAKASAALKKLPTMQQQLFLQCARDSNTTGAAARCLNRLFVDAREHQNIGQKEETISENPPAAEHGIIATGIAWLKQIFEQFVGGQKSTTTESPVKGKKLYKLNITYRRFWHYRRKAIRRIKRHLIRTKHRHSKITKRLTNLEKIDRIRVFQAKFKQYTANIAEYNRLRKSLLESFEMKTIRRRRRKIMEEDKNGSTAQNRKSTNNIKILSPSFFSIVPNNEDEAEQSKGANNTRILSHELLRLYEDPKSESSNQTTVEELFASVPNLLKLLTPDRAKRRRFLNNALEALGLGEVLDRALEPLGLMSDTLDKGLLETSEKLRQSVERLTQLRDSLTREQLNYFLQHGYTFLAQKQLDIVHGGKVARGLKRHVWRALGGTKFQRVVNMMESEIEHFIWQRATDADRPENDHYANKSRRQKRALFAGPLPVSGPVIGVLSPFAFVPQVNSLQLYTLYVLSPQAFIPSYNNPAAFYMQLLTPWVFLANLFSPQYFSCLCVSPTTFEANLMSPQFFVLELLAPTTFQANLLNPVFFDGLILSPQTLIADLLAPQILQPKVLSPQTLLAGTLSPAILAPNYFSDEQWEFQLFSPQIASPFINSKLSNAVFLFSPEIFGGHNDESEFQTEGENVVIWPPSDKPGESHAHPNIIHP